MKKMILLALLVSALCITPLFANGPFSIGVNAGTQTGIVTRYQMGSFDMMGNIGWEYFRTKPFAVGASFQGSYRILTIGKGHSIEVPLTMGLGVSADVDMDNRWDCSVNVPIGFEYVLQEVPMTLFIRVAPGLRFLTGNEIGVAFSCEAFAGGIWRFD